MILGRGFPRFPSFSDSDHPRHRLGQPLARLKSPSILRSVQKGSLCGHQVITWPQKGSEHRFMSRFFEKNDLYNLYIIVISYILISVFMSNHLYIHLTRWFSTHFWVCKSFTTPKMSAILPSVSVWRCVHPPCAAPLTPKRTCWGRSGKQIVASGWVWPIGGCHKNIQKWNC